MENKAIVPLAEATLRIRVARDTTADVAIVALGLPESAESEAADREDLRLPANQVALLNAVAAVQRNIVAELVLGLPRDIHGDAGMTWSEFRTRKEPS